MSEQFFKRVQFNFASDSNGYETIAGEFSNSLIRSKGYSCGFCDVSYRNGQAFQTIEVPPIAAEGRLQCLDGPFNT